MIRRMTQTLIAGLVPLAFAAGVRPAAPIAQPPPARQAQTCVSDPPDDFAQSIHAPVDGEDLELRISSRFAGAVDSLTWRGKEFINVFDHGRQISYAWHFDGLSECLNPTEPGSANDSDGPTSTSQLLSVCLEGEDRLTSTTQPAYWLAPGQSGFCSGGVETAQNDSLLSDQVLEKTIQIGYRGLDNVIEFTARVSLNEAHDFMQLEIPTGYLTYEFSDHWWFNPLTGELEKPAGQPPVPPWSFMDFGPLPPILSTPDGAYAMGAYTAEEILDYSILATDATNPQNRTNKWNIVLREQPADPGSYTYQSFVIVGTLEAVQDAMGQLYELHPVDLAPPTGYVDAYDCREIQGWAWDPKVPDQPIEVEVYRLGPSGEETMAGRTTANAYREDLEAALGDNGQHGFGFVTGDLLPDSGEYTLRFHAINSHPDLPQRELFESGFSLACPQLGPAATGDGEVPPLSPGATVSATTAAAPTDGRRPIGALPCLGGVAPLAALGLLLERRRGRR